MDKNSFDDVDWFVDPVSGCWMVSNVSHNRAHVIRVNGEFLNTYRWFWILSGGKETPDTDLHHDCLNRACVNPFHLREMSHRDHARYHAKLRYEERKALAN